MLVGRSLAGAARIAITAEKQATITIVNRAIQLKKIVSLAMTTSR